ncbi:MAG: V-type ATP synthase subunit I [Clostridiales bacterium]|nr:V-type ATP synthase subunit I [Clostridiales bacterium]
MKKLTLAGVASEKQRLLETLAFCGAVEVKNASYLLKLEEELMSGASMDAGDAYALRGDLEKLQGAVGVLQPFAPKKSMLAPKPQISQGEMQETLQDRAAAVASAEEVLRIARERAAIAPERGKMEGQILSLSPWVKTGLPLSLTETKFVKLLYGTFPAAADLPQTLERMEAYDCVVNLVSSDTNAHYVLVLYCKGAEEEVLSALRELSFSRVQLREYAGTPAEEICKLEKKIEEGERLFETLTQALAAKGDESPAVQRMIDSIGSRILIEDAHTDLMVTAHTFFLNGFVPETRIGTLERALRDFSVAYQLDEVDPEVDDPPVLLKNSKLVQPYEMVTELYGLPLYNGIDPTPAFAPFFWLFFGIMFGDMAYGLLMMAISGLILLKVKPEGFAKKLFSLVFQGGVAAFIIGLATGSFFGDAISIFSGTFLGKAVGFKSYFDPLKNPMEMLYISCVLGMIHLLWGMTLKFYLCLREKDYAGAFFDIGLWWLLFVGIAMFALNVPMGRYVMMIAAVGLVLTQGRSKGNIFSKLFSGVLSLYNITGFLGDVLSYARLMALMLSSAVIASVFNAIGVLGGPSVIGLVLFIVVFCIGHFVNMFTGGLGAYVHASRLQYVEFFGKFYDSGGRAFIPYKVQTKYHTLISEEEN